LDDIALLPIISIGKRKREREKGRKGKKKKRKEGQTKKSPL